MSESKTYPLSVVLTITTGRLLAPPVGDSNGMPHVYDILGWMTGDQPFTHRLPRVAGECKPWLERWFPELTPESEYVETALMGVDKLGMAQAIAGYLVEAQRRGCRKTYDVARIPRDDHERKNPIDELVEMRGSDHGVIVVEI